MHARNGTSNSTLSPPGTIPAASILLPQQIRVDVTILFVILYGLLFLGIAYQLFLISYYRYKKLSYRTIFVALCLAWALLRVVMFAFYFDTAVCTVAFDLPVTAYWVLYALPVCVQFATLSLFAHYYIQVIGRGGGGSSLPRWVLNALWAFFLTTFVAVNTACVVLTYDDYNARRKSSMGVIPPGTNSPYVFPALRVGVTEGLFLFVAIVISVCIVKIARSSALKRILEGEGMSALQWTSIVLVILYLSRVIYNIVATQTKLGVDSKGYNWPIVADEADYGGDMGTGYVTFGIVLFIWEFLPTVTVVIHFRVKSSPRIPVEPEEAPPPSQSYFQRSFERRPLLASGHSPVLGGLPGQSHSYSSSHSASSLASSHSINA